MNRRNPARRVPCDHGSNESGRGRTGRCDQAPRELRDPSGGRIQSGSSSLVGLVDTGHTERSTSLDTTEASVGASRYQVVVFALLGPRRSSQHEFVKQTLRAFKGSSLVSLRLRAARLSACCTQWGVRAPRAHPELSRPIPLNPCRDRLCPSCGRSWASGFAARLTPLLQGVRRHGRVPRFLTLTQRSRPGETLRAAMRRLQRDFSLMRRRPVWKNHVRAFIASREVTVGRDGAWHAHLHLAIDGDYWPQTGIAHEWKRVTRGESCIVDIREAKSGVERELLKYAFRFAGVAPERLVEYAPAIKGTRRISTGGAWYGCARDQDLETDDGQAVELFTFYALILRAGAGDPWAMAVKRAVDSWLARQLRNMPEKILWRLLPNASVH